MNMKRDETALNNKEISFDELRKKQSVRATFKLPQEIIDLLGVIAGQLGIKQKSLLDQLVEDTSLLVKLAQENEQSHEEQTMRRQILDKGERADGRGLDDIRSITSEVGVLPRTHGSALFTRGQTQALAVVTLGTSRDEQRIDSIDSREEVTKSFMLQIP